MRDRLVSFLNIRFLIVFLAVIGAVFSLLSALNAAYVVQRQQLVNTVENANYIYANKLARTVGSFVETAQQQLKTSAEYIARDFSNPDKLSEEVDRLRLQTSYFNSVVIVSADYQVVATSPNTLPFLGKKLQSSGVVDAIERKVPTLSKPYLSAAGNLLVLLTYPLFSADGQYLGVVGGSVYLKQESVLDELLGKHFYSDSSYLYVVDRDKKIIYHPEADRVGEYIYDNEVINNLAAGGSGSQIVRNSRGTEMVAGYAFVPESGWGIVSQTPLESTLEPLTALMFKVVSKAVPAALILLILIWWLARAVATPLAQLAHEARTMDQPEAEVHIRQVRSWYFEAQEIKRAMLFGVSLVSSSIQRLKAEAHTDPLTGLGNRRFLDSSVKYLEQSAQTFSVIAIDIDHFKSINDRYGHDVGDGVIRGLAEHMRSVSRAGDILCRVGGEEFVIVLPGAEIESARLVSERLRLRVEQADHGIVGRVTVSIGLSTAFGTPQSADTVFKRADEMLYQAKARGRNRVVDDQPA